jgi:hypothetical protein
VIPSTSTLYHWIIIIIIIIIIICRLHSFTPLGSILNKFNPVHFIIQYFLTAHFNIILMSTHRSLKLSILLVVPSKIMVYISNFSLHILLMYCSLPWAVENCVKIANYDAYPCAIFSTLVSNYLLIIFFSSTMSLLRAKFHNLEKCQIKLQVFSINFR